MQQQNLSIKTFVSKHKKVLIATVLSLILVVASAISLTLALFNDREDRTININFHNETVTIDAEINPSEQMFSSDVTLLKLFQPSDEVPLVHLLNSAQVTILLSDYEALGVRFKIGFEYHNNTSVSNETLKLIQSYLNNSVDFSSLISATPYLTYSWKQINKASGDNYYYLCNSSSNQVYLNTTTQSYSLNVVDGVVNYSGIDALNLDINSLPNDIKAIFEKLSLTLQIEVCPQGSSYEFLSPTYTYGKVALFDAQGGSETPAKLLSGNNLTLPTTSKLGQVFGGWCDSPALTNVAGQANASITQSNSVQTYYAKFTPETYEVTLDPAGGKLLLTNSSSPYVISGVTYGSEFLATSALTVSEGRDFLGYFDQNDICYIDAKGTPIREWDKTESATLTAKYSAPFTYEIIYSGLENAYFTSNTVYQYTCQVTQITIPNPVKDGYTFNGWTVRVGNSEQTNVKPYEITTATMGTIYLKANFTPIQYTATFADGESSLNFTMETPLILHTLNQIYSGYEVIEANGGWQLGEKYPSNQAISGRYGNVKFKKVISVEALMLDTQSLDATVDPMALGLGTTGQISLPDAVRDGHIFTGWYREPNCQTLVSRICDVDELIADIVADAGSDDPEYVLYAGWETGTPKYTVTLHNNSADTADSTIYFNQNAGNKQTYLVPNTVTIPTKSGYTFAGYFSEPNSQGIKFFGADGNAIFTGFSSAFVSDYAYSYELYAVYTENTYKITFDTQGGAGVNSIFYTPNTTEVVYPLTTKFGYDFTGWEIQTASGNWSVGSLDLATSISTQDKNGDVTLVAKFTPKTYTITFNYLIATISNGKVTLTPTTNSIEYTIDTASIDLSCQAITGVASLTGHNFLGWKVSVGLGAWSVGANINGASLTLQNSYYGNVVLTAEYELVTYEMKFQYVNSSGTVLTDAKYANATKSIYFTYQNSQITLREHLIEVGVNFTAWKPKTTVGGWSSANSFSSGQVVNLTSNQYVNGVIMVSTVSTYFERGTGDVNDPFIISNATQLINLSSLIESETTTSMYNSLSYALGHSNNSTTFGGEGNATGFTLSGTFESIGDETRPFKGIFNGNNFEIRNLTTNTSTAGDSGLFGCVDGGKVINVVLMGPKITATAINAGGLVSAAKNGTYIENCHVKTSSSYVGSGSFASGNCSMLVGYANVQVVIKNCSNAVNATFSGSQCGGVVGYAKNNCILLDLVNRGNLTFNGTATFGGVVGCLGINSENASEAGSCFAMNLYNSGEINCAATGLTGMCVGFKGLHSHIFNAYSDGVVTHPTVNSMKVIGGGITTGQNEASKAANGLLNRYYKNTTVTTPTNSLNGHSLTEEQIAGSTPKDNLITEYEIFNTHSFASLATLLNVWIYDLQQQQRGDGGLVPPVHHVYGNATGTTYSSLNEYISALGINKEELHYWQTNTTKKTAELNQEDIANCTLALTYVDLCGGTLNGEYSRVYAKLLSGNNIKYQDSEKIYVADFIRSGYEFQGLYLNAQGEGTPLNQSSDANGAYYNITVDNNVGLLTYYAVWTPIFSEGRGTADDPFIITSGEQLKALADVTNNGTYMADGTTLYSTAHYHQPISIHMENVEGFTPIGTAARPFTGYYYGYNQWIYANTLYNNKNTEYVGVFGYVQNATIKAVRVSIKNWTVGKNCVGSIVGYAKNSTLTNLYNNGSNVEAYSANYAGGLVGYLNKSILVNSWSYGNVKASNYAGGLVGLAENNAVIENNASGGSYDVTGTAASSQVGGIVGRINQAKVFNNLVNMDLFAPASTNVGTLVGNVGSNDTTNNIIKYNYYLNTKVNATINGTANTAINLVGNTASYASVSNNWAWTSAEPFNFTSIQSITANNQTVQISSVYMMMNYYVELVNIGSPLTNFVRNYELSAVRDGDFTYQPDTYTSYARQVTFITDSDMPWGRYRRNADGSFALGSDNNKIFDNHTGWPYHYANVGSELSIPSKIPEYSADSGLKFMGWYKLNSDGSFTQITNARNEFVGGKYYITQNECLYAKWIYEEGLIVSAINTIYNGSAQALLRVENDGRITRYCEVSEANKNTNPFDSNVNAGSTAIPTKTNAGTYYYYYYKKPNTASAVTGLVTVTISPRDIANATFTEVDDYIYTGSAITPSVTVNDSVVDANNPLVVGTHYTITYSNNINVGQATITINGNGNFGGTKMINFLITNAENSVRVVANTLTYNATQQALVTVSNIPRDGNQEGELRYSITNELNGANYITGSSVIPTAINAGEYTVYWYAVEIGNFSASSGSVNVKIEARNISNATISTLENKVYTKNPISQTYTVTDLNSVTLAKNSDYTEAWSNNTNVGTAKLTITGKGNYKGEKTATFQITKATNPIVVTANILSYQAKGLSLVTVTNAQGTVYYSTTAELTSSTGGATAIPTKTDAGSYTVWYFCAGNNNYSSTKGSVNVTISKRNIASATVTLDSSSKKYDKGNAVTVGYSVIDSVPTSGTILNTTSHFTASWSNNINVGDAKLTITGKGNYEGSVEKILKITQETSNPFDISGLSLTYTGLEQALIRVNSEPQGDAYLSVGVQLNGNNYSSAGTIYSGSNSIKKATNAGVYIVYYYVVGNTNYASEQGQVTSVINKAVNVMNIATQNLTYNGKAQNLVQSGTSSTTIYYSTSNILNSSNYTTGSTTLPVGTNAGTYTIYCYAPEVANYLENSQTKSVVINPRSITLTSCVIPNQTYTGQNITPNYSVTDTVPTSGTVLVNGTDYTGEFANNKEVGTAKLTLTAKNNYTGTKEISFQIVQAGNSLSISALVGLEYNNADRTLIQVEDAGVGDLYFSLSGVLNNSNFASGVKYTGESSIPKGRNAGNYTVYYYSTGDESHKSVSGSIVATISPRSIAKTSVSTIDAQTYSGSALTPTFSVIDIIDGQQLTLKEQFASSSTSFTYVWANNTNAGEASLTLTGIGNYNGTKTVKFTINKNQNNLSLSAKTGLVYNGEAQELITVSKNGEGGTYYSINTALGSSNYSTSGSTNLPTGTNAMQYKVYYYSPGNTNYNSTSGNVSVTISPRDISNAIISAFANSSVVYTGSPITQNYSVTDSVPNSNTALVNGTDYTAGWSNNINVGTVTLTITGKGNYTATKIATFQITAASIIASVSQNGTLTYNGTAQTPKLNQSATVKGNQTVTWKYATASNAVFNATIPTYTNAGTYSLWYEVSAPNHTTLKSSCTITIGNANFKSATVSQSGSLVANGSAQTPTLSKSAETYSNQAVTWTFCTTQNGTYSTTVPTYTNAGSYTLYFKASAPNHNNKLGSCTIIVQAKLSAPSSLSWSGGTASWGAVTNASSYNIQLYKGSSLEKTVTTSSTSYNFTSNLTETASTSWKFKVQAVSGNVNYANSEYSADSVTNASYQVTYNANGGSVSPSSVIVIKGQSTTTPTASRSNCTFAHWGTSQTASSGIEAGASITPTRDVTYYAVWKATLTISRGGSYSTDGIYRHSSTLTYDFSTIENFSQASSVTLIVGTGYWVYGFGMGDIIPGALSIFYHVTSMVLNGTSLDMHTTPDGVRYVGIRLTGNSTLVINYDR